MKNPNDLTITINVTIPEEMVFMRLATAIQQFAYHLSPGAKISHNGDGFVIDATVNNVRPLYEQPEERAA